jgi:hypothetical protein
METGQKRAKYETKRPFTLTRLSEFIVTCCWYLITRPDIFISIQVSYDTVSIDDTPENKVDIGPRVVAGSLEKGSRYDAESEGLDDTVIDDNGGVGVS